MNLLIIEDEITAANRLQKMIGDLDDTLEVKEVIDSIIGAVNYLSPTPNLDLIFMDVQLADGLCFDIFEQVEVDCPIIFTTAYDEYALQAFKVNSVDYLLKPISKQELSKSLEKFKKITERFSNQNAELKALMASFAQQMPTYKYRFLAKIPTGYASIETDNIAYFYSEDKLSFCITNKGKRHILDYSLEEINKSLPPKDFIKISRNFIVSHKSIKGIHNHFNSRLKLDLKPDCEKEVFVSRSHLQSFKQWIGA